MEQLGVKKRDYGIDLLRIIAMLMIVVLHMLGNGGMQEAAGTYDIRHRPVWMLMSLVSCCVNIYGMISGYVGIGAKHRISNIVYLWLQVVTYMLGGLWIGSLIWPDSIFMTKSGIIYALHPVTCRAYWYFTAYFALFFFMPALNHIILTFPKKDLIALVVSCVVLLSVIPTICQTDLFHTKGGYSVLWLAVLYLIGGTIRRLELSKIGKPWIRLGCMTAVILICVFLNYLNWAVCLHRKMFEEMYFLFDYTSPTNLAVAAALIIVFADSQIPSVAKKVIRKLSPLTFGVYLVHVNPFLFNKLFNGQFADIVKLSPKRQIVAVAAVAVGFYLACSLVDAVRLMLFRLLKIKALCQYIEKKLSNIGKAAEHI